MIAKLGHFETIENTDKPVFSHAKDKYIAGYVRTPDGGDAQYIMFADTELPLSSHIECDLELDLGTLYRISQSGKISYMMRCFIDGDPTIIKVPACKIKRALVRTVKNPEDVRKLSLWDRLFRF